MKRRWLGDTTGSRDRVILFGVTSDKSLTLMTGFPEYMAAHGWTVHVVSSPGRLLEELRGMPGITAHPLGMTRGPSLWRDALSLVQWIGLLRDIRPSIISVGTPKAGLVGVLAAFLTSIPIRVYVLRGLRSETLDGAASVALNLLERVVGFCATSVLCVSASLRDLALHYKLAEPCKLTVLGSGSSNGVNIAVESMGTEERAAMTSTYLPVARRPVIGYIGRVVEDKGLETLAEAFRILSSEGIVGDCVIIGGDDHQGSADLRDLLNRSGWRIAHTGHVDRVTTVAQIMDVLCLPSLREGFPNVVLEAAVLGIACVGSDATGVVDAIKAGETGLSFPRGDASALATQLKRFLDEPDLAARLGAAARRHARENYDRDVVWPIHAAYYERLLPRALTDSA